MDWADPELFEELMAVVREVAERGAFTLGPHVETFERDFASYCQTEFAIGVSSGTEALVLALRALGVGPGDGVIVPANSFIATAEAVSAVGAVPRCIDVDPSSHLMTAAGVSAAITREIKCVIPVHLYGATVDLDPILEVTSEAGINVIEDACQAHGACYRGRRVGTFGALGCFSFYPAKNLGAWGDGGAVVTADPVLADRVRLLRAHGERPRYHHRLVGSTARLDALQAAILRRKLLRLDRWNDERRRAAATMRRLLADVSGIDPVGLATPEADNVFHLFVVRSGARDALRAHLTREGVATGVHYPVPIHRTEAYASLGMVAGSLPVSEALAQQICSLPIFPGISDREIERIVSAVGSFSENPGGHAR